MDYIHEWEKCNDTAEYRELRCVRCGLQVQDIEEELKARKDFQRLQSLFNLEFEEWHKKQRSSCEPFDKFKKRKKELENAIEKDVQSIINDIEPCLTDNEALVKDVIE